MESMRFRDLKLGSKLAIGFGISSLLLVVVVGATIGYIDKVNSQTTRVITLRAPTAKLGVELQNGLNASLAQLRGYMLLGNKSLKDNRQRVWSTIINPALARMTTLSQSWTVEANKQKLTTLKELFAKLEREQDAIEKLAHTSDNRPAEKILLRQAAPQAAILAKEITAMIDQEGLIKNGKGNRKALLGMMADVRGTLGLGLASIRAFLLTGDAKFRKSFEKYWAKNDRRFADLSRNQNMLDATQSGAFERFSAARAKFKPLPPKMFEIRGSTRWDVGNYRLGTNAAPVAKQLNRIIKGMIANQQGLMDTDAAAARGLIGTLKWLQLILLAVSLLFSLIVGVAVTRSISQPVRQLAEAASQIARGNLSAEVQMDRRDEVGDLANAFGKMIASQREKADVAEQIAAGDLSVQLSAASSDDVLGHAMLRMLEAQRGKADVAEQIAAGNLSVALSAASDRDTLGHAMIRMKQQIHALATDTNHLVQAALNGSLEVRLDSANHAGEFRTIIEGMNQTLDALLDPINEAAAVLTKLADCDLRARMSGDYKGGHAIIKESLNSTASALEDALGGVALAVTQVNAVGEQMAEASQEVAKGAADQASSLEQTSASLEEISSMTRQSADNAGRARGLADSAKGVATEGAESMRSMVDSMQQIKIAAESTAQIIKDINEIALKTNLLALNAAVEAARAGDAGRGFAVVAEEVRNLALRSKDAAQRTEELIGRSVQLATEGRTVSVEVNDKLGAIVTAIDDAAAIVNEIALAGQEQARGIGQINDAVSQMDRIVQQSAATAEESASAAEELSSQAEELTSMVSRFQLGQAISTALSTTHHRPPPRMLAKRSPIKAGKSNGISNDRASDAPPEKVIPMEMDPDFADF